MLLYHDLKSDRRPLPAKKHCHTNCFLDVNNRSKKAAVHSPKKKRNKKLTKGSKAPTPYLVMPFQEALPNCASCQAFCTFFYPAKKKTMLLFSRKAAHPITIPEKSYFCTSWWKNNGNNDLHSADPDLLNFLPVFHDLFLRTKKRPKFFPPWKPKSSLCFPLTKSSCTSQAINFASLSCAIFVCNAILPWNDPHFFTTYPSKNLSQPSYLLG